MFRIRTYGSSGILALALLIVATPSAAQNSPGGVSGCTLWLRPDVGISTTTDGASLSGWNDQSGTGNNASQGTSGDQPTFENDASNNVNFNPVILFNGSTDQMALDGLDMPLLASARTIVAVGMLNSIPTGSADPLSWGTLGGAASMFFGASGSEGYQSGGTLGTVTSASGLWQAGTPNDLVATYTGILGTVTLYSKGAQLNSAGLITYVTASTTASVGNSINGGSPWNGVLGDIMVFSTNLSAAQRQRIETYLSLKYGYTMNESSPTNYVATDGTTVVWNASSSGKAFDNNITGIGQDNTESFLQKQSMNIGSGFQVEIGLGSLAATNSANTGTFGQDKSYLVWGDDGEPTAFTRSLTAGANQYTAMQRSWMAAKTNWTDQNVTISTGLAGSYYLLVATDSGFSNVTQQVSLSGGQATFSTSLLPTGDFFTVAQLVTLPVTLVSFTGTPTPKGIMLTWTTGSIGAAGGPAAAGQSFGAQGPNEFAATGASMVTVQRSTDGLSFTDLATVSGTSFLDPSPAARNWYRLRASGAGDDSWESWVVQLDFTPVCKLYPNPASAVVNVDLPQGAGPVTLTVFDNRGALAGAPRQEAPGQTVSVDVSGLPAGIYYLVVRTPGGAPLTFPFAKP